MAHAAAQVEFERKTRTGGYIDALIPESRTLVEQKSQGVNLDTPEPRQGVMVTPFEQAKRYADSLPNPQRPDFIITCNFTTFRVHDLRCDDPKETFTEFSLEDLADKPHLLDFLSDPTTSRTATEQEVSIQAGTMVGRLYDAFHTQYLQAGEDRWTDLNVLCVRLVFCLFAEDSGLFKKDAFASYLSSFNPDQLRGGLLELFQVLDTPVAERSAYLPEALKSFPYVNGGLFRTPIEIPALTEQIRMLLVEEAARHVDWSRISPTVFGGVFESTLNPETRRQGGMHYTSVVNIHRVIDPLFLDDLTEELGQILTDASVTDRTRKRRLEAFQNKIANLHFADFSAGSGNFLTETYLCLRRLENKVIAALHGSLSDKGMQTFATWEEVEESPIKVGLHQFHGIEINDFAVEVARTAMWIAQLQSVQETEEILQAEIASLPLHDKVNIVHGNALRMDWNDVVSSSELDYIVGNPPFIGARMKNAAQKDELFDVFAGHKNAGNVDYVAAWFMKCAQYIQGHTTRCALVASNSICQGEQVPLLWQPLTELGIHIDFAHNTFRWRNEANDTAHVFVIIVGFSIENHGQQTLFRHTTPDSFEIPIQVNHINPYLIAGPDQFITRRTRPLSDVAKMYQGCKPIDGGHLLLDNTERDELIAKEPQAARWIRKFSMGKEFIDGTDRYCLWLKDCPAQEITSMPLVRSRVQKVKEIREASARTATNNKARTPWLFAEIPFENLGTFIAIPTVSSQRRKYIPMDFVSNGMIPGNKLYCIPTDSRYTFGILMSQVHNAWMRVVAGRLKSDYNYSNTIVYNNLVFPNAEKGQRARIEACAQSVLDARDAYPGATLKDLYDPDNEFLYPALAKAHRALDAAVEEAYGLSFDAGTSFEEKEPLIVAHLFELYNQATSNEE